MCVFYNFQEEEKSVRHILQTQSQQTSAKDSVALSSTQPKQSHQIQNKHRKKLSTQKENIQILISFCFTELDALVKKRPSSPPTIAHSTNKPPDRMIKMLARLLVLSSSSATSMALRPAVAWLAGRSIETRPYATTATALRYQSSTTTEDDSAMSRSRAPFRMPRNSPDDSVPTRKNKNSDNGVSSWNQLGLWTELVDALTLEMKLEAPTPVQNLVIPSLLKEDAVDTAFLAATGSG